MGFPTLYFFPGKVKGTPIQYEGAREIEDLAAFIKEKVRASTRTYDWTHTELPPSDATSKGTKFQTQGKSTSGSTTVDH